MKGNLFLLTLGSLWCIQGGGAWSKSHHVQGGVTARPAAAATLAAAALRRDGPETGRCIIAGTGNDRARAWDVGPSDVGYGAEIESSRLPILRLRGGKVKYKNLREVKERREMMEAAAEGRAPKTRQKHRAGGKARRRVGSKMDLSVGGTAPQQMTGEDADADDDLGIAEWATKGKNIFYGAEREPSDDEGKEKLYEMEEAEAMRMTRIISKRKHEKVVEEKPVAEDGLVAGDEAFPEDTSSEDDDSADGGVTRELRRRGQTSHAAQKVSFADTITGGSPSVLGTAEGIEVLLKEVENACATLRDYIEPLTFACMSRPDIQGPGRDLLHMKYQALMSYVIELQSAAICCIEQGKTPRSVFNDKLERAWAKLEVLKMLEVSRAGDIADLMSELRGDGPAPEGPKAMLSAMAAAVSAKAQAPYEGKIPQTKGLAKKRAEEAEDEAKFEQQREWEAKIEAMVEDADAAAYKGYEYWNSMYLKAEKLEDQVVRGVRKPDDMQLKKISRKAYFRAMYFLAHQRVFPPAVGDHRKPSGGASIILEGGRKPAPYEILTNTGDVIRQNQKRRNRRYSNPRMRLRHRYHDYLKSQRGAQRYMQEAPMVYGGEKSGVNPNAKHSVKYRMV